MNNRESNNKIAQSINILQLSSAAQSQRSFKKDAKVINSQQLEEDQVLDDILIGQDDDMSEDESQKIDKNSLNINKEQKLMKKFSSIASTGKKQKNDKNKRKQDFSMYSEDIAELLEAFHENSQQIQGLYPLLRVNQVFNFKNDIDDIVGFELDELVYYITRVHHLSLTKWKYKWQEVLELVLPAFAKYGTQMRRLGRDNWYITGKEKEEGKSNSLNQSDNGTTFDEEEDSIKLVKNKEGGYDIINITDLQQQNQQQALNTTIDQDELLKVRQKGQEIFQMKIDKHFDKIKEIFLQSCSSSGTKKNQAQKDKVQQNTQNVVDEGQSLKEKQRMKLIKLKRYMDDIAYICGLVFIDKERYLENGIVDTRSQKEFVKKLKHLIWLDIHEEQAKETSKKKNEQKGITEKKPEVQKSSKKLEYSTIAPSRMASQKSQRQQLLPILKTSATNFDNKIISREDEKDLQNDNDNLDKSRVDKIENEKLVINNKVRFEDELYKIEKNETKITFDQFLRILENYFEGEQNIIALDANHEFDSYFQQQSEFEKNMNDEAYDPFVAELQQQIEHYEKMLGLNQTTTEYPPLNQAPQTFNFKTQQEKDIIVKMLEHAKTQLQEYLAQKSQFQAYEDMKNNQYQTLEQLRQRAVRQIFFFYTGQHWKWNMSFDQLMEKKSLLDFGEFNIFCKDFRVPLPKSKIQIVFKKCSINHRPHELEQFSKALETLGVELNNFKIEQIEKRLDEIAKIEKLRRDRQMKRIEKNKQNNEKKQFEEFKQRLDQSAIQEERNEDDTLLQTEQDHHPQNLDTNQTQQNVQWDNLQEQLNDSLTQSQPDAQNLQSNDDNNNEEDTQNNKIILLQPQQNPPTTTHTKKRKQSQVEFDLKSVYNHPQPTNHGGGTSLALASVRSQVSARTHHRQILDEALMLEDPRNQHEPIQIEKIKLKEELAKLKAKTDLQLINEFFEFLELHDLSQYRKKLRGLRVNPFDMRDNYQRIAAGEIRNRELQRAKLTAEEIREKVKNMRDKRLREQKIREMREKKKLDDQRVQQQKVYEQNRKKRAVDEVLKYQQIQQIKNGINPNQSQAQQQQQLQQQLNQDQTYLMLRNQKQGLPAEEGKNLKLTLEDLERMNYEDIWENKPDDFRPGEFFEDDGTGAKQKQIKKKKINARNNGGNKNSMQIPGLSDSIDEQLQSMIIGNNSLENSFENRNEKLYQIKKERKMQQEQQQPQRKQLKIDSQPHHMYQQAAPMTERANHKRGANQPQQQPGKLRRGTTPDQTKQQSRSKSNKNLNKSLNKSVDHSQSPHRKQSFNPNIKPQYQSLDLSHQMMPKTQRNNQSQKNLLALSQIQPIGGGLKNQKLLAIQYPSNGHQTGISGVSGAKSSRSLAVSHSTANLKTATQSQRGLIPAQNNAMVPYNMKQMGGAGQPQIPGKYKQSLVVNDKNSMIKAQQIDKNQKIKANINMANILKLHDKQIEKGLNTVRRL